MFKIDLNARGIKLFITWDNYLLNNLVKELHVYSAFGSPGHAGLKINRHTT